MEVGRRRRRGAPWAGSKLVSKAAKLLRAPKTRVFASSRTLESSRVAEAPDAPATWSDPRTLARHFRDHGGDFGDTSPRAYADRASSFLKTAVRAGYPIKVDEEGIIRIYDPNTNTFGAFNPDGSTRTFFKPTSNRYWMRQPGVEPWSG
jgi:pyocin large subunit-like protein